MRPVACLAALVMALISPGAVADPCSQEARAAGWSEPSVEEHGGLTPLSQHLAEHPVVYVGEVHNRFEHHLTQLEIICRLREHGPLAIGLEFFQAPAQGALDAYVNGHGDLQRLLQESDWFTTWGYDPRLYAPILRFARRHRIALIALNVPGDLVRKVARHGPQSLSPRERARLPASIHRGPDRYVERIRRVFERHQAMGGRFEKFLTAQLMWDEGMAQRSAEFLLEHPGVRLVVLAGEGHVVNGDGIPDRLARRVPGTRVIVVQSEPAPDSLPESLHGDEVRVVTPPVSLPPAGRLGVRLGFEDGGVTIAGFAAESAARDAGLAVGDSLLALNHRPVGRPADVRLALWDKAPGTAVTVSARRGTAVIHLVLALR